MKFLFKIQGFQMLLKFGFVYMAVSILPPGGKVSYFRIGSVPPPDYCSEPRIEEN